MLNLLVEGNSIRSVSRITGIHKKTIMRLLCQIGERCQETMSREFRNLDCQSIQADELWTYIGKKNKNLKADDDVNEFGDQYVFVALDADTKLIPVFTVGKRNKQVASYFMWQLRSRVKNRFQLTTDKFVGYFDAVDRIFGDNIDYATLLKVYHGNGNGSREGYSPSDLKRIEISKIIGKPEKKRICTSHVERQNLTIRMQLRRFTRLTNAFSKKLKNLKAALALHFYHYNFMRIHQSLRVTPAMEAGITNRIWTWSDLEKN